MVFILLGLNLSLYLDKLWDSLRFMGVILWLVRLEISLDNWDFRFFISFVIVVLFI